MTTTYTLVPAATDWWFGTVPLDECDIAGLCDADAHRVCAVQSYPDEHYCLRACVDLVRAEDAP